MIFFKEAIPVWPENKEKEMNMTAGFRALISKPLNGSVILRVTASTLYRFFINGRFAGYGPARGPHGYYRVDEWNITCKMQEGENVIAVEVVGYNINTYYTLDQPSFLQAEIECGGRIYAATGCVGKDFEAGVLSERVRKVPRYSFQRAFMEAYKLKPGFDAWKAKAAAIPGRIKTVSQPAKKLISRSLPFPEFKTQKPARIIIEGCVTDGTGEELWKDRSMTTIGAKLKGFPEEELEWAPSIDIQKYKVSERKAVNRIYDEKNCLHLDGKFFSIVDFETNCTGFIGMNVRCSKSTRLLVSFDEIFTGDDIDFKRLTSSNVVAFEMECGEYTILTFEPYVLRFMKFMAEYGECEVRNIHLCEYANPDVNAVSFACSDELLDTVLNVLEK